MYSCECGDYCIYCHPEMCGVTPTMEQLALAKQMLAEIASTLRKVADNVTT